MLWSCHPGCFVNLAVKSSILHASRRLRLCPWWFSSRRGPDFHPRIGFCFGTTHQVHSAISVYESPMANRLKMISHHPYLPVTSQMASSCSSQWKKIVGAGQASRCLRAAVRQAGKGSFHHCQRWVRPYYLVMDKRRQKVRQHQQWSGLKIIRNN
jgi:hypothetical protein